MNNKDENGRFTKGYKPTAEEQVKKSESLKRQWKERDNYVGDIINEKPYIYNSWRSFRFSRKGKNIGCSKEWENFQIFYNDVRPSYVDGYTLQRKNKSKPFSKDNFIWMSKEDASLINSPKPVFIEFENKKLSLKEWSYELEIPYYSIKARYYRHKDDWSVKDILFGKQINRKSKSKRDYRELSDEEKIRAKASKMISSYRIKDRKRGFETPDYDISWFIENILTKTCVYCGDDKRIGADRIDNDKGHIKANIVPCCVECNTARSDLFTFEEMKMLGKAIRNIKNMRNKEKG